MTMVTCVEQLTKSGLLGSSFGQCESTDEAPSCLFTFYVTTQYLFNIVTGREILAPLFAHTVT